MKRLRVDQKSNVEATTHGEPSYETVTTDERDNLPPKIELGETYRNARIKRHVSIRVTGDR